MASYTKRNLLESEDRAKAIGLDGFSARFLRKELDCEQTGISLQHYGPGVRQPFGHDHSRQEELFVVVEGSMHGKVGDDLVELATWDVLRIGPDTPRRFEGGPDGATLLVFGAPTYPEGDGTMLHDFWQA